MVGLIGSGAAACSRGSPLLVGSPSLAPVIQSGDAVRWFDTRARSLRHLFLGRQAGTQEERCLVGRQLGWQRRRIRHRPWRKRRHRHRHRCMCMHRHRRRRSHQHRHRHMHQHSRHRHRQRQAAARAGRQRRNRPTQAIAGRRRNAQAGADRRRRLLHQQAHGRV
jgi:hypothetical protein